jgi:hypothetical protein
LSLEEEERDNMKYLIWLPLPLCLLCLIRGTGAWYKHTPLVPGAAALGLRQSTRYGRTVRYGRIHVPIFVKLTGSFPKIWSFVVKVIRAHDTVWSARTDGCGSYSRFWRNFQLFFLQAADVVRARGTGGSSRTDGL